METSRPELEERMNLSGALKDHERSILQACNSYVMARLKSRGWLGWSNDVTHVRKFRQ